MGAEIVVEKFIFIFQAVGGKRFGKLLLAGFLRTRNDAEAFRWSVAAATASVTQEGTQPLRYGDFERLLGSVRLRRLA